MNIENIEAFVLVNHFGSINKASKALFLSQPSVTARIQTLERELDTKLFDRVGRQLVITEQAKEFLPYAEQIIQYYKTGKKQLKVKELSDQLIIGCTELVSNYLIPKVIPAFTNTDEAKKGGATQVVICKTDSLIALAKQQQKGIVLNSWGESMYLPVDMIDAIWTLIQEGRDNDVKRENKN